MSDLARDYDLQELSSWPIVPLGVHCVVFEINAPGTVEELVDLLGSDARVESVQPMNTFRVQTSGYDDPYVHLQHGVSAMQVAEAHQWARGNGVRIAVIDTGVDVAHPELRDRIRTARDFVEDRVGVQSPDRHGTAVAGVIASTAGNGFGIVGVAPGAQILALRACWQKAEDSALGVCNSFTLAKALAFAVERKPDVLNLSLAGPPDRLLERLVRAALDKGVIVVAAVGDDQALSFPCAVAGVLGVQSVAQGGDWRESAPEGCSDLVAPGLEILTASPGGGFDVMSGHSLATAHVTGVAALVLERRPRMGGTLLLELLAESSVPGEPAPGSGQSVVNACAAVSSVVPGSTCPPREPGVAKLDQPPG